MIRRAFSEWVRRIYAECGPENGASRKLLERLGLSSEAHLRRNVFFRKDSEGNPVRKDTYVRGIINE